MIGLTQAEAAIEYLASDQLANTEETMADWLTRHGIDPKVHATVTACSIASVLEGTRGGLGSIDTLFQTAFEYGFVLGRQSADVPVAAVEDGAAA
jgi:hypothetical protein